MIKYLRANYGVVAPFKAQANAIGDNVHNPYNQGVFFLSFGVNDNSLLSFPCEFQHGAFPAK
jgi:hypothetical protein|tara:strand:+ start:232 stop:417 length:186 start_codon:yes stop_codon:yes gene_type:complete